MDLSEWPRSAPITFAIAMALLAVAVYSRLTPFNPSAYVFNPFAFRSGQPIGFFTAPFIATSFAALGIGFLGLYLIGADFESAVSRKKFVLSVVAVVGGSHLLSLLLSFLNYRQFLAGPGYLVIGLAVCFSRFNPDARVTVMGFTAPIVWVPWILAIVSVLIDPSMLFSGVVGLVTGFLAAKIAKLGTAEEAEWRHKGGYYAYVKGEKPRPRQYGFSGKGRKLAD